ncbi:hypothetical protein GCM10017044_21410 [Kordiimonas sediminis]|uniref:ABC transporter substrate-binding protein n=1 Tax=Kordiimonas sediminis TaxID=1735581 RepID=A0A919E945_9PROT|nr:ABC transporter substrate-binding protein [Kordiimonas sediminis]GHF26222.1 hypothetical protein GCM10017044_21410 [Kordiimonas sediminis]
MIRVFKIIATSVLIAFTGISAAFAQDRAVDDPKGAMDFIANLSLDTQTVWSDSKLTADERSAAFKTLFERVTDIELLSKGILGRHYRTASEAQRRAYMAAMTDYIINELDIQMQKIGFKKLDITGTTPASGKNGHLFVRTKVDREQGEPMLADWRVRKKDGVFQIVNLEVEGINLLITNREVFSARIKEVGLDGLIAELRDSVAKTSTAD